MPKHIHILNTNIWGIPIGTATISDTEANAMLEDGNAVLITELAKPIVDAIAPPIIVVKQEKAKVSKPKVPIRKPKRFSSSPINK